MHAIASTPSETISSPPMMMKRRHGAAASRTPPLSSLCATARAASAPASPLAIARGMSMMKPSMSP